MSFAWLFGHSTAQNKALFGSYVRFLMVYSFITYGDPF